MRVCENHDNAVACYEFVKSCPFCETEQKLESIEQKLESLEETYSNARDEIHDLTKQVKELNEYK